MGHFALVNNGYVDYVITIDNSNLDNLPFPESEPVGQAYIATLPDLAAQVGTWWQCSYNNNFRGCYPGAGYSFDGTDFVAPVAPEPAPESPPIEEGPPSE